MTCWSPCLNLEQERSQRRCFCVNTLSKSCPSPPLPTTAGSNLPKCCFKFTKHCIERIPALAASLFNKLCCAIKPNQWNSTTMITNLFLKSYNQFRIWRQRERKMPQHDMIGFQCIPGEDSVQFPSDVAKILSKKLFLAKTERGWEAAQQCATYPASSARARVQKCTKMQAGRSFDVASAKFSTFTHKLLEMSFNHIGLNNSCWVKTLMAHMIYHKRQTFFKPKKVLSEPFMAARVKETLQTCALADRCPLSLKPHKGHFSFEI